MVSGDRQWRVGSIGCIQKLFFAGCCEKSRAKLLLYQNAEVPAATSRSTVGKRD
jgi:hypothetical protein